MMIVIISSEFMIHGNKMIIIIKNIIFSGCGFTQIDHLKNLSLKPLIQAIIFFIHT